MEAITLKAAAREVRALCVPGRVRTVAQVTQRDAVLTLGGGGAPHIVLGVNPDHPTRFATARRPPAIAAPSTTARWILQKWSSVRINGDSEARNAARIAGPDRASGSR